MSNSRFEWWRRFATLQIQSFSYKELHYRHLSLVHGYTQHHIIRIINDALLLSFPLYIGVLDPAYRLLNNS